MKQKVIYSSVLLNCHSKLFIGLSTPMMLIVNTFLREDKNAILNSFSVTITAVNALTHIRTNA